jgi:RNA polymerase sigma factor (TIGR02999 family)
MGNEEPRPAPAPPASTDGEDITALLRAVEGGDRGAMDRLFSSVYGELRRIARRQLAAGPAQATLDTTALVHEAYLKLSQGAHLSLRDRFHFFATSARAMRLVLIDRARSRLREKRGGGARAHALEERDVAAEERPEQLVALDGALARLEASDPDLARIVEWRFFGGLSVEEIASTLEISDRTVKRHWRAARAILFADLSGESPR